MTHKFTRELVRLLADPTYKDYKLFHYCSNKFDKQANAAFLMGAFMIIILKKPAREAWEVFYPYHRKFTPIRDAIAGTCTYKCTIEHCLNGLDLAIKLGCYDYDTFDV